MSENHGGANRSFEERLSEARAKRGLEAPPAETDVKSGMLGTSALGVGLRVGIELLSALAVGVLIGWLLDQWLHARPLFLGLFVLLGGGAGMMNVWRVVKPKRQAK